MDLVEVELPYLLAGRTVNELTLLGEIHVAAISREGRTFSRPWGPCSGKAIGCTWRCWAALQPGSPRYSART